MLTVEDGTTLVHGGFDGLVLPDVLARLIADAVETLDTDRASSRALLSQAAKLLSIKREDRPATTDASAQSLLAPWQIRRVSDYIQERLGQSLQLRDLANVVRLSSSHFSRAFKASFGKTPHTYIVEQRVTRARNEMLNTRSPLSEIALSCGFADQAHLTRMFRREMGMAPSRWRRANMAMAA